jgi:pyruvate dehydrogenase E1 component alpha subunit
MNVGSNDVNKSLSIFMLYKMMLIRSFENIVSTYKMKGEIYGMAHCYNGQEAIAVGVCSALGDADYVISNHRPHGHAIAKNLDLSQMMAEIFGKATGTNGGKGGSMHINDPHKGFINATGIVGSGIPVACGSAFASKYNKDGRVTSVFFGDGAANEGVFYECLNLSAVYQLPIVFILEDNGFAITTNTKNTSAFDDYTKLASACGIRSKKVDGQNVEEVYKVAHEAILVARERSLPTLIHAKTIRFNEHAEGSWYLRMREARYRDNALLERDVKDKCPIKLYTSVLHERGILSAAEAEEMQMKVNVEIQDCLKFVLVSPDPDPNTAFENIFI